MAYMRLELRRTLRTPGFIIFTIAMPLVMYAVFTNLSSFTGQSKHDAALYAMVSVGGYGAIGALLNYGAGVVTDRTVGWLRQLRITPLSSLKVVLAKGIIGILLGIPPVLAMCAAAALLNGVRLPVGEWLAVIALLCFGAAPFVLLGLGIGYLCTAQTVQPANFLAYFGLSILGGLWLPLKIFPQWMQTLGAYTPTHGYADLSWRVVFHDPVAGTDITVLVAWLALFAVFAVVAYRRSASRRDA